MKANTRYTNCFISLVTAGLLATSVSQAATVPGSIFDFTADATENVFSGTSKGWRDPAFGDMGWTHSSDWGTFSAQKGQIVTIKMVAADAGIHPGITVWFRGDDDTAPDEYVVDHFYPQNADFVKVGVADESTGAALGNIVMRHVAHAYDQDGNPKRVSDMHPKKDAVPGQLELKFKAKNTGKYIFVVGGFNPDASVDSTINHDTTVTVKVTSP